MVNTEIKKRLMISTMLTALFIITIPHSTQAAPRINAKNAAYFQDLSTVQANAHKVESISYGEALFLMHSGQDLQALVTLEQQQQFKKSKTETQKNVSLHPQLLRASLAAKQGINSIATDALTQAQSLATKSSHDLDRLMQFQAELAYEKGDMTLLSESLANITHIQDLPDPDSLYFLHIQSALAQGALEPAQQALKKMLLSPWKAYAQTNIALWHYRINNFQLGIELLNTALADIDQSIQYDAFEYWYKTGRQSAPILTPEQHKQQQYELSQLSEKILSLIGYGHIKVLENAELSTDSSAFKDQLTQAQKAIFQIPQNSIYAHQGLELLVQVLITLYNAPPKQSLFVNQLQQAKQEKARKQQLQVLLKTLAHKDKPMLTRLRSEFALITLSATDTNTAQLDSVKLLLKKLTQEYQSREQLLAQPQTEYEAILSSLYSTVSSELSIHSSSHPSSQLATVDLSTVNLSQLKLGRLPVHKTTLVQWLSQPSTQEFIQTLQFFKEGIAFSQQWHTYKDTLEIQAIAHQNRDNHHLLHQRLMQKNSKLHTQLNQANHLLTSHSLDLATPQEQRILQTIKTLKMRIQALQGGQFNQQEAISRLEFMQGQIQWQQALLAPQRQLTLKAELQTLADSLQQNQTRLSTFDIKTAVPQLNTQQVKALDKKINDLDARVTTALHLNKSLYIESFKDYIRLEQKHLRAALVKLKLKQAVLIQNAGVDQ